MGPARSVLDCGCGSARLTLAIAAAGADEVVGFVTSAERLAQGRERLAADPAGARVELRELSFKDGLPFADDRFDATVSRLSLMIPPDPVAVLGEYRRVTASGGPIVTALWAPVEDNPWFALPRTAAQSVVGIERADYARVFGRIGGPDEAADVHRAAGLTEVVVRTLRESLDVADAPALWSWLIVENGYVRRLDATLTPGERSDLLAELDRLTAGHRVADGSLSLARTMTLVTARA